MKKKLNARINGAGRIMIMFKKNTTKLIKFVAFAFCMGFKQMRKK